RPALHVAVKCPSPPHISPLALHDALPIYFPAVQWRVKAAGSPRLLSLQSPRAPDRQAGSELAGRPNTRRQSLPGYPDDASPNDRSEEHTSELQSRENLVCRLLLEKKNEDS